jgi:hypothetical protein
VSDDWETKRLVYTGRRLSRRGVLHETFIYADDPEMDVWLKGKPKFAAIGRTYEVQALGDRFQIFSGAWDKDTPEHARKGEWAAKDRAAYLALQAAQAQKRVEKEGQRIGSLTLDECRDLLVTSAPAQRAGLLAAILKELRV